MSATRQISGVIRLVAIGLLLSLIGLYWAVFATMHLHVTQTGRVYVHSHPLANTDSSSPEQRRHSHTDNDYLLIGSTYASINTVVVSGHTTTLSSDQSASAFYTLTEPTIIGISFSVDAGRSPPTALS